MTEVRVAIVDVYVLRFGDGAGRTGREEPQVLVLRRAPGLRSPGTWESVHGHIAPGETPVEAARRELREETGLDPVRLYNLSRVESLYLHRRDLLALSPAFCAVVAPDAAVRTAVEHDLSEWVAPAEAERRLFWPRERRALADVMELFAGGDAGGAEDVLRIF